MNRIDFMKQLESLLQNISPAERDEALQYYSDYFNDAGAENEQSVMEALGNPAKVAETIKRDLYGSGFRGSFADNSYQWAKASDRAVVEYAGMGNNTEGSASKEMVKKGNSLSAGIIILIVILCVLASPLIVGLAGGVLGILAGIIGIWIGLVGGFGFAALALFVAAIALLIAGFVSLAAAPAAGVGLIGASLLCCGLGILFLMAAVGIAGYLTPAIIRAVRALFNRKKA